MIVMLFRFISLFLIIAAVMLLGADAVGTLESGGQVQLRSLGAVINLFAPGAAPAAQGPLAAVLGVPAWAVLGLLGLLLAFVFRHRTGDEEYEG